MIFTFKVPGKFISWGSIKTKMSNCIISLLIPTIVEITVEGLPLLVRYAFSHGGLDIILKMCEIFLLSAPSKSNTLL